MMHATVAEKLKGVGNFTLRSLPAMIKILVEVCLDVQCFNVEHVELPQANQMQLAFEPYSYWQRPCSVLSAPYSSNRACTKNIFALTVLCLRPTRYPCSQVWSSVQCCINYFAWFPIFLGSSEFFRAANCATMCILYCSDHLFIACDAWRSWRAGTTLQIGIGCVTFPKSLLFRAKITVFLNTQCSIHYLLPVI